MQRKKAGAPVLPGLEGVIAAETMLSQVDGEAGRLIVRGCDVEELAGRHSFEAVCGLLWEGRLPGPEHLARLQRGLGAARLRAFEALPRLGTALCTGDGMEALRAALAAPSTGGGGSSADAAPDAGGGGDTDTAAADGGDGAAAESRAPDASAEAAAGALALDERLRLTAAVGVFAAAWQRRQAGGALAAPDPSLGHAADLLRLIRGEAAHPAEAAALDAYLVTVAEHGMNASTFTARVVTSTQADAVSALVAALGALSGPLHGGAPGPVLDMLDAIGAPEAAPAWLRGELERGRRIMGLGHRVYRVRDPRAAVLEAQVARLEAAGVGGRYLALARAVERAALRALAEAHPERRLETNVEFYTAVLLDALALPRALFTPVFASARVAGWLAHIAEQRAGGRLIRPRQRYIGAVPPPRRAASFGAGERAGVGMGESAGTGAGAGGR